MVDIKKIKELRLKGLSLREIAEKLKITRKAVEAALKAQGEVKPEKKKEAPTSVKKATGTAAQAKRK